MTTTRRARRAVAALAVAAALASAGCARRGQNAGGGLKVDVCEGYRAYDALDEPDPSDRGAVLAYMNGSLRVLARIDPQMQVDHRELPSDLRHDLETMAGSLRQARAGAAGDPAPRQEAINTLTYDSRFAAADLAVAKFVHTHCRRGAPPAR